MADATHKAAVIRESALKSTIFIGVPRVRCSIRTRRNWILESYTHAPDIGHLIFGRTGGSHGGRCESQFADRLEEVCYSSASVPSTRPPQACSCLQDKRYEEWPQGWGAIMKPIHTLTIRFRPPSTTLQNRDSREHQRDFGQRQGPVAVYLHASRCEIVQQARVVSSRLYRYVIIPVNLATTTSNLTTPVLYNAV